MPNGIICLRCVDSPLPQLQLRGYVYCSYPVSGSVHAPVCVVGSVGGSTYMQLDDVVCMCVAAYKSTSFAIKNNNK